MIAVFQIWSRDIVVFLNYVGFPVDVISGAERVSYVGLAEKRRVEWTKAWLIFLSIYGLDSAGEALPRKPQRWS